MSDRLADALRERGWNEEDIRYATGVIRERDHYDKSKSYETSNSIVYWIALLVTIVGNIILSLVLMPFILLIDTWQLYIVIGILAISFGAFFNILITDIDTLETKHHIIAGVLIPGMALLTMFLMMQAVKLVERGFGLDIANKNNPILIGVFYMICFMIPYFVAKGIQAKKDGMFGNVN